MKGKVYNKKVKNKLATLENDLLYIE